ncbi:MAG TPA: UDP-N-acetylglucosamine diphosphorylase/glucosamine-1-phosphate N-acetyltransferase [Gammaproteobacteria bacterium]|nr:UDP-N-acetylglucosamine diphosphorylase/glucosamine-1-phosphate N-acetyltransferase [Gammaproteobacteria bacterium]
MSLTIIILAAGKGSRMKSSKAKVMHKLAGKPLLQHVIDAAQYIAPEVLTVVVGSGSEQVAPLLADNGIEAVLQTQQLGTGHAVKQAKASFANTDHTIVLYGDVPLITSQTLQKLVAGADKQSMTILTTFLDNPQGYGRIVRDLDDKVSRIVEQKDADEIIQQIKEVNTGILLLPSHWLSHAIEKLDNNNAQGEYYLTDLVARAVADKLTINTVTATAPVEVAGVNDRQQLAQLERYYQQQQAEQLMQQGVTLYDPHRLDIRGELTIANDVIIDINVIFEGQVTIEAGVSIGPNCVIKDSHIGQNTVIEANSVLEECKIGQAVQIGPFARVRPGTVMQEGSKAGNFVELKNATIGNSSKINHLSYIGDTTMGEHVNIGAGTITCNYDGANKNRTEIHDNVFVGSGSQLVAPITIAPGATIGAGTTVRKSGATSADSLTVTNSKTKIIKNWQRPKKVKTVLQPTHIHLTAKTEQEKP